MLAEARKFGLHLTLANQNLAQISSREEQLNLRDALSGNVGTLLIFRLGAVDAARMAVYTKPEFGPRDLQDLPDHHAAARLLVNGRPTRPFVFRTLKAQDPHLGNGAEHERARKILQANRAGYTRRVTEVEQEIETRRERVMADGTKPART